ncbi:hypothetical protein RRU01S_25_00480 [Agrobacterium rubi TR3 = NBRC 13261]|uniref:Uncharacterized protein n=1 Tax=Agrobacterium rubi TR3 = NBRC 13261 TaxID=1368415 RepID=A0A081D0B2_9HYPH|nr:hypothetical protein [Agrobacterium rubi]MBP1878340.1 hypothetical protein [Agrobacterium rubi]MCL6653653.1 hypothetical protein [Agrobacterium rubi]GAK72358.1 hypothetical protein RRU01S_25_00480 [Agrobacterium rubi TR3 = NBRC 13261]
MSCSRERLLRSSAALSLMLSLTLGLVSFTHNAYALSELRPAQDPTSSESEKPADMQQPVEPDSVEGDSDGIPLPDPLVNRSSGQQATSDQNDAPQISAQIEHDISKAPEPVRRLRQLIIDAASTGDIEKLRPLVNTGPNQARVDGDSGNDPIAALKSFSGDPDGLEVLAIIIDLLSTGYAKVDAGTPDEMYVFPYFAGKSLTTLTPPEKVELLRIITAGDLADMQEYGNYSFYRIGISPDGQWKFFTAGD